MIPVTRSRWWTLPVLMISLPAYLLAGFVWGGWIALRELWWEDVRTAMKTTTNDDDDDQEEALTRVVTTGGSRILPYRRDTKGTPYAAQ